MRSHNLKGSFGPLSNGMRHKPTDLIIQLFIYSNSRSHRNLETRNQRLLIISRNPSSNLFLGCHFEGLFYSDEYEGKPQLCPAMQWISRLNNEVHLERIMAKTHRFKRLRKLSIFNKAIDTRHEFKSLKLILPKFNVGAYALVRASEKHLEELVITGNPMRYSGDEQFHSLRSKDLQLLPKLRCLR